MIFKSNKIQILAGTSFFLNIFHLFSVIFLFVNSVFWFFGLSVIIVIFKGMDNFFNKYFGVFIFIAFLF